MYPLWLVHINNLGHNNICIILYNRIRTSRTHAPVILHCKLEEKQKINPIYQGNGQMYALNIFHVILDINLCMEEFLYKINTYTSSPQVWGTFKIFAPIHI